MEDALAEWDSSLPAAASVVAAGYDAWVWRQMNGRHSHLILRRCPHKYLFAARKVTRTNLPTQMKLHCPEHASSAHALPPRPWASIAAGQKSADLMSAVPVDAGA